TRLASVSWDGTLNLWDLETGQSLDTPITEDLEAVTSLAFSSNGSRLASVSRDGTLILWDLDPASWRALACRIANRNLTQAEWQTYIGNNTPYRRTCPDLPPGE
ncbi:MAG: hypothetical protein ACE10K_02655, partial [Rhodothermales bacterium]